MRRIRPILGVGLALALVANADALANADTKIEMKPYGKLADGRMAQLYTLKSDKLEASITTYGGRIVTLKTPDRAGKLGDITLGFASLGAYLQDNPYFGALIGRYGNRIGGGRFVLNNQPIELPQNDHGNTLHGGPLGFDKRLWNARIDKGSLLLDYVSAEGEQGFPGRLATQVRYTLEDGDLRIDYHATTDRDTVVNLTNHAYFNLAGESAGDILGHQVTILADRYTPVDSELIPTGEIKSVAGTAFDFRKPQAIGARIAESDPQLLYGKGYDHNWVLNAAGGKLALAASVYEPTSGRVMKVLTTEPGLQFYTGNFLDGTLNGKSGKAYAHRTGFCMETQHFPDSPNKPAFPSTLLKPGQPYRSTTVYRFSVQQ
ncbi:aldose epimerase family protein [Hydrocarboniphaga sp.]|uniref:aldose epimerase family protein n=1 Tax=Hydrocarboniphaga sp. TaxID=2033016 RepID=UPI003D12A041